MADNHDALKARGFSDRNVEALPGSELTASIKRWTARHAAPVMTGAACLAVQRSMLAVSSLPGNASTLRSENPRALRASWLSAMKSRDAPPNHGWPRNL